MGDDQHQEGQVHCSFHLGVKPAHSSPGNQMCASMIDLKKVMTRNMELEEELKSTRDGYEEEIAVLVEKNEDLTRKLGVFMGDPAPGGDDDHPEDYIIIDDTDSDPDSSDDVYKDEAGADIMESSTDQNF